MSDTRDAMRAELRRYASAAGIALVLSGLSIAVTAQSSGGPTPSPTAGRVRVNRTVPRVTPPSTEVRFSTPPKVEEIFRARVFDEPLVPIGSEPTVVETQALADAIQEYRQGPNADIAPFERFLHQYANSAWRPSLLANLGARYWAQGAITRALDAWDTAWQVAKDVDTPSGRAVAALGMAGSMEALATLGKRDGLEARLTALGDRVYRGSAGGRIRQALFTLGSLRESPDLVIPSGAQAVEFLRATLRKTEPGVAPPFAGARAGQSLAAVEQMARAAGLDLVARVRPAGAPLPSRAIVHWSFGHWSAVVDSREDRYLVRDPALGGERWIPRTTLEDETTPYVLVSPSEPLVATWTVPTEAEATATIGYSCPPGGPGPNGPGPDCGPGGFGGGGSGDGGGSGGGGCGGGSCNMPTFTIKPENASLFMIDTPIGYVPPRGPSVPFTLTYDYRQTLQPQTFSYTNVGPQWTLNWVSYVLEMPMWVSGWNNEFISAHLSVYLRGGGEETYLTPGGGSVYLRHPRTRAQLVRVSDSPIRYERRLPDGSLEVFGQPDAAPAGQRRVFLTEVRDPAGNAVSLTYDAQYRLVAVADAIGQVSTLQYDAVDTLKVIGVTDPFGRVATFGYTAAGQLASMTDVGGLTSRVTYGPDDFIASVQSPYGVSTFKHEWQDPVNHPYVETTDPLGGVQRVEYHYSTTQVPSTVPAASVPTGFASWNADLNMFVTLSWDQRAWAAGPGDPATATVTKWFLDGWNNQPGVAFSQLLTTRNPHYVQRPGESRIWYAYPGQNRSFPEIVSGWSTTPSVVARVLDDGSTQQTLTTVNDLGNVIERTDPLGRRTSYVYAANGIDLLEVRQTTGSTNHLLATYANYTAGHQPQTSTDAAGQTTTLTYTATGQIATATNPKNETTTWTYDSEGRLRTITAPVAGATTTYTYDDYGRVATVTTDGATIGTAYDAFDRPTVVTYPDNTTEQTTYDRLDVATRTDRLGRETRYTYDELRRLTSTRDPAGRTIRQQWCNCGSLDALIDANGNRTRWERDVQGRVTREIRADDVTDTLYIYDLVGRLKTITDPKDQVTTHTYLADDSISSTVYTNAQIATPSVSFTHDTVYPRVATMVDGTGTTTYTYKAPGQLGAGQIASVDGPLTDDTIAYTYDELGRVVSRSINGAANTVTWAFDALGRATSETNVLGTFTYTYDGVTNRLATLTYPNGQTSSYSYLPPTQDHRLQTIHHKYPGGGTLSKFDYTYDTVGNILTWQQQADSAAPTRWRYGYDRGDQLIGAIQETATQTPTVLHEYAYGYDPAGNRLYEQVDDTVKAWTYDALNRLQVEAGGGLLQVRGTVNEPATVTIQGLSAAVSAAGQYSVGLPVVPGTNVFSVTATDPNGNTATAAYEVDIANGPKTFTYDANGNLSSDSLRSFEWDARNQLVAVNVGPHRSEFSYNGSYHRVRTIERENGSLVDDALWIWPDIVSPERRASLGGGTTTLYRHGVYDSTAPKYFTRDQLDSIASVTSQSAMILTRAEYAPYGIEIDRTGPEAPVFGFGGSVAHQPSDLMLMQRRPYDGTTSRWLSEDPSKFTDGPNLYTYVLNNPTQWVDPKGLSAIIGNLVANGNMWPGFDPQDDICSWPGGSLNGNPCALRCCEDHDSCYRTNKCNWSSWLRMISNRPCDQCNKTIVGCVLTAKQDPFGCLSQQCRPSDKRQSP